MLRVEKIDVYYSTVRALTDVSLEVRAGEVVTILGANGAGKSTLLRSISGSLPARRGRVYLGDREITRTGASQIVRFGLCHVPEGKQVFASLSVANNLKLGAYTRQGGRWSKGVERRLEEVLQLFPRLKERLHQRAGTLSGGEQQMLAIGRSLMSMPDLLLLDEPSLGLAPLIMKDIFRAIEDLRARGLTLLLVEQNVGAALEVADRGYVLQNGRIVLEGTTEHLLQSDLVLRAYLGRSKEVGQ